MFLAIAGRITVVGDVPETVDQTQTRITVRYWAAARAAAGVDTETVEVSGPVTLAEVLAVVRGRHPEQRFGAVLASCSLLVDERPVTGHDPEQVLGRAGGSRSRCCRRSPAGSADLPGPLPRGTAGPSRRPGNVQPARRIAAFVTTGLLVLVLAVAAALGFGLFRLATDGRFRGTRAVRREVSQSSGPTTDPAATSVLAETPWAEGLGERATLVQFSSAFCAPCRVTRRTLEEVARIVPGVVHIEVDAEDNLDLVRRVGIMRTPTTLVLDASGREVNRAAGAPTKQAVIAGLGALA